MSGRLIYELRPDSRNFQRLKVVSNSESIKPLMYGRSLEESEISDIRFQLISIHDEKEEDLEEDDIGRAALRQHAGLGDCVCVIFFSSGLVLSQRSVDLLGDFFNSAGQLFPITVEMQKLYIFNCTHVVDAVSDSTLVRCAGTRPAAFVNLKLDTTRSALGGLFKVSWPENCCQSAVSSPPPNMLFATADFVTQVESYQLTGFRFIPIATE